MAVQKDLLNETNNVGSHFRGIPPAHISSLVRLVLGGPRKTVIRMTISILAVLGFLSFASPAFASVPVWTYAGVSYPNQAAAVAAMQAAGPYNASLTQVSITQMGFGTVIYQYVAPQVAPTYGPWVGCTWNTYDV
jgi:hypothetical protein